MEFLPLFLNSALDSPLLIFHLLNKSEIEGLKY